ncbi:MAG: FAD-binding oxidoreductase [Planctomycetes bacterium]|nr:FAD-binding oxidoreductase [Planctomycetota bacterium]
MDTEVVIVGAGLAGAATAFALVRQGVRSLLVAEQEATPTRHSSGRNAALVRRSTGDAELDRFCDEGAAFLAAPPADFPGTTDFRRTGSWLVAAPDVAARWVRPGVIPATGAELARALPPYAPPEGAAFLRCPDDGVADPHAVVAGFLAAARAGGATVRFESPVDSLAVERGRIAGVVIKGRFEAARVVVDAAGAWAGTLGRAAGGGDPQVRPYRRHLLRTQPDARIDPAWPWVWDHLRGFYARPEQGGWLACGCDEAPWPASDCAADPAVAPRVAALLAAAFPPFAGAATAEFRAGHRTRRDDERFVLRGDARIRGLHYACGLGGHGLTAAAAVGAAAARAVVAELGRG